MATVTTSLPEVARDVFADLGYTVTGDGTEFRAARDWKEVRVVTVDEAETAPSCDGSLRCFVTWHDRTGELARRLRRQDPGCTWAVVGVHPDGEYEVVRAPPVAE